jgi:hypothetical protein
VTAGTDVPDLISVERARDLKGRECERWIRRGLLTLVIAVPVLALLNVFGQSPQTTTAASPAATLTVRAPSRVRGGLIYEARFRIAARHEVKKAILVLGTGWLEGMTLNTIEPSPLGQASDDGSLRLELGHIPAGHSFVLFVQFQVDPTNVGRRNQTVTLLDGARQLLVEQRKVTVFP